MTFGGGEALRATEVAPGWPAATKPACAGSDENVGCGILPGLHAIWVGYQSDGVSGMLARLRGMRHGGDERGEWLGWGLGLVALVATAAIVAQ